MAGAFRVVFHTVVDPLLVLERTVLVLVRGRRHSALHGVVTLHLVGEQRRSHLGHKTVR